jgi:hypothetical protein
MTCTIAVAIGSAAICAAGYAGGRWSAGAALQWAFNVWALLTLWYGRYWLLLRKVGGKSLGDIYQGYRDGTLPKRSWLDSVLSLGVMTLMVAIVVNFFRG